MGSIPTHPRHKRTCRRNGKSFSLSPRQNPPLAPKAEGFETRPPVFSYDINALKPRANGRANAKGRTIQNMLLDDLP